MKKKIFVTLPEKRQGRKILIHYLGGTLLLICTILITYINWLIAPLFFINWLQITVFYAMLRYPYLFPWIPFFPLTIFQDFLLSLPPGTTLITSTLLVVLAISQKRIIKKTYFYISWCYFCLFYTLTQFSFMSLIAYIKKYPFYFSSVFNLSLLLTILCYPIMRHLLKTQYKKIKKVARYYET